MRFQYLPPLALLASIGATQSPQLADYRSLCSIDQDTGTKTFDNGVTAEYTCRVKVSSDTEPTEEPAKSSEACAALCGSGCSSAVWQYTKSRCLLYDSEVTLSHHARGSVYLKPTGKVNDPPSDKVPEPDCEHERKACEDEVEHQNEKIERCEQQKQNLETDRNTCQQATGELNTMLTICHQDKDELDITSKTCQRENDELDTKSKTCQREKDDLDTKGKTCQREKDDLDTKSKTCQREKDSQETKYREQIGQLQISNQNLQNQLDQCRRSSIPTLATATCPSSNGLSVSYAGRNWKIFCQKTVSGNDGSGTSRGTSTRDQCVNFCAQQPQCKWAHWNPTTRGCWTYTNNSPGQFTIASSWDAYLKV